jgi:lysophospholipase L1-like esterase
VPCDLKPTSAARLIVMGDSISYGYGTTQPGSSTCANDPCDTALAYYNLLINNDDTQWPTETNTTLPALFNVSASSIPVVNVAYPGDTTSNIATNQLTATTANPSVGLKGMFPTPPSGPSIVVITIAGNDMLAQVQNMSSSSLDSAINTMISNIETAVEYLQDPTNFPDGVYIYLANLYDPSDATGVLPYSCLGFGSVPGSITNATLEAGLTTLFNDEVQLAQQLNFAVIDDLGHFHGHGLYAANQTATSSAPADPNYDSSDPTDWFYTDCIHPTNAGHNELRRLFFEAISGTYIATDI